MPHPTNMVRLHGRSPRGTRACASAPFGHWTRLTVLGALGAQGIVGAMGVEAATGAAVFRAYLDQVLLPELRRMKSDAVLVMDNLPAHKAPRVRALLDASGFAYRYLPSYSPDPSPVRGTARTPIWAKVKAELRRVAARTAEALHEALGPALGAVIRNPADRFLGPADSCAGWGRRLAGRGSGAAPWRGSSGISPSRSRRRGTGPRGT